MWRILVPLKYIFIEHPEKRKFDLYFPMVLAIIFTLPLLSTQFRADILAGKADLLAGIASFLGVLTGFFIASLAAIATFGKTEMDGPMPGEPLRLEYRVNSETFFENLTRRRFLSFLFGYLAFVTLVLFVVGFGYFVFDRYFVQWAMPSARIYLLIVFWVAYFFFLANVLSNTLLGLYYLTDRIHRPNPEIRREKTNQSADADQDNDADDVGPTHS